MAIYNAAYTVSFACLIQNFHVCRSCHFVDLLGGRHEVEVADIAGTAVDPLCRVLLALIDGINQSETRRFALIVFCAGTELLTIHVKHRGLAYHSCSTCIPPKYVCKYIIFDQLYKAVVDGIS